MAKQPRKPTQEMIVEDEAPKKRAGRRVTVDEEGNKTHPKIGKSEKSFEPETDAHVESGTNMVDLPSGGLLWYPKSISYRDILVKDEEILSSATSQNYARTVNSVLKSILRDNENFEKLATNDRDFLLVWLWANNYSPIKEVEVTCPKEDCGEKHLHRIDLTKLEITDLSEDVKVPLVIPLEGASVDSISVRHNIVADEIEVEAFMASKAGQGFQYDYLMNIASIDLGMQMPMEQKIKWVRENISGRVMSYVRKYHSYFNFGLPEHVEYKCPACKEVTRGPLPFQTEDVLFPASPDGFEELL